MTSSSSTSASILGHALIKSIVGISPRQLVMLISLFAFLLVFPSVNEGLIRDDFYHRALLKGETIFPGAKPAAALSAREAAFSMFMFFTPGENSNLELGRDLGVLPWWTDARLEIKFWRPLSALTHWLDYQWWPDSPTLMHLHSALWYTLVVLVWGFCLLNFGVKGWALLFAMVAYGLDSSHIGAVGWLANRNILIATVLGFLSLAALHKSVTEQRRSWLSMAVVLFALTLLSAEGGIAIAAYYASYCLFMDRRHWLIRLVWMLPFAVVLVAWRTLYGALGFAAKHSGTYLDPVTQTQEFLANLWVQTPILLMDQFTGLESLPLLLAPQTLLYQAWAGFVVVTLLLITAWPLLRTNRLACFLLVGALLAIVPAGSTLFTGGRLLFFSGAGIASAYGLFSAGLVSNTTWFPASRGFRFWAWFLVVGITLSNVIANTVVWGKMIADQLADVRKPGISIMSDIITPYNGQSDWVIAVNPPISFDLLYVKLKADYLHRDAPGTLRTLAPGVTPFMLTRVGRNAVEIYSLSDSLAISSKAEFMPVSPLYSPLYGARRVDTFFAGMDYRLHEDATRSVRGTKITVKDVNAQGVPKRVRFDFDAPLESSQYQWLYWDFKHNRFLPFTLPALGESTRIAGPFEQ